MNWTFRAFRIFGIDVRIHWTFPVYLLVIVLSHLYRFGFESLWVGYIAELAGLTFLFVLLHEFGHCWAARKQGIPVEDILLWPLGGLARIGGGGSPKTDVFVAVAGPAVNGLICGCLAGAMAVRGEPWDWQNLNVFAPYYTGRILPDMFRISWMQFAFNIATPAFPMDGGRIMQGVLAMRLGFERATAVTTTVALAIAGLIVVAGALTQNVILALIGVYIISEALHTRHLLQEGALERPSEFLGHDFSMGYTSLERGGPEPERKRRRPGFFARFRQRRAERRARRLQDEEARLRERVDQLLDKVSREGLAALSPEERRSLEQASRRFQEFEAQRKG